MRDGIADFPSHEDRHRHQEEGLIGLVSILKANTEKPNSVWLLKTLARMTDNPVLARCLVGSNDGISLFHDALERPGPHWAAFGTMALSQFIQDIEIPCQTTGW
jgi:hypothetical protein